MRTLARCGLLAATLMVALAPVVRAQETTEVQAQVVGSVMAALEALDSGQAEAIEEHLAAGALVIADGEDAAVVLGKAELIDGERPAILDQDEQPPIEFVHADCMVTGDFAFAPGAIKSEDGDLHVYAFMLHEEDAWRLAALVVPGAGARVEQADLPDGLAEVIDDLVSDDETGMQAALSYLPDDDNCLFVVAGPGFLSAMAGREAIEDQVNEWEAPAEVEAKPAVMFVGDNVAGGGFPSSFAAGEGRLYSANVLVLARNEDAWQVVVFAATLSLEPPGTEGERG